MIFVKLVFLENKIHLTTFSNFVIRAMFRIDFALAFGYKWHFIETSNFIVKKVHLFESTEFFFSVYKNDSNDWNCTSNEKLNANNKLTRLPKKYDNRRTISIITEQHMYPRQVLADGRNVASPAIYATPPAKYHRASIKARARQNDHTHALSKAVGSIFFTRLRRLNR